MPDKKIAETKAVETAAPAEEKKTAAAKKPAEKKATAAKKPAEKKATAAKKPAEKKATAAKKPAAKKTAAAVESKVVIQANGLDVTTADLIEKAKKASGEKNIKKIDLYIVPGTNKVYPVINGIPEAEFDLF
ncbi:DUF6465 family protein [Ruminococcus flavefaciens]|uniref:DUF6465 family protein n=1 Tax=Ruminococcus flavefaciens TaxID=1265 RepID=UPI0026EE9EF2|nr:DUF6465 family protein [Ruminococcus flavefaciens]